MEKTVVSVIVPVYKTEKFLPFCLDSILNQTWEALELILVDDESPDKAPEMCDEYAAKYENVKTIHKKNGGLGLARNTGLLEATGKYVCFVDSDDALECPHTIEHMVECAEKKNADVVVGSFRRFNAAGESTVNQHHLTEGEYTATGAFRFRGFYQYGHLAYNWGKLYRREFLLEHEIFCLPYPFTQDKAMNMKCYSYHPVYAFIDESVYRYRENEESVTYKYKKNFREVWISIVSDFIEFLQTQGREKEYTDLTDFHLFFGSFFLAKQELVQEHGLKRAKTQLKLYGKNSYVQQAMKRLAKGSYNKYLPNFGWKLMIQGASMVFCMHGYLLYALGILLLRKLEVDTQITKRRYRK